DRADVHDASEPGLLHGRQYSLAAQKGAFEVDGHDSVPFGLGEISRIAHGYDARHIHQDIETTMALDDVVDATPDLGAIGYVQADMLDTGRRHGVGDGQVGRDNFCATVGERLSGRSAYAAGPAGDEGD